jgi:hypothetical protein
MSFEHAQEMYSRHKGLDICTPLSLDASLQKLDVPEDLYLENHELYLQTRSLRGTEASLDLSENYERRLVLATYGHQVKDVLGIDKKATNVLESGKGDPFLTPPADDYEQEFETPQEGNEDLQDFIAAATSENSRTLREDRVRLFFIASRMILHYGFVLNFVIDGGDRNYHQVALRREETDEYYFINSWWSSEDGLLVKDGPLTIREVCGISQTPWSKRPDAWGSPNGRVHTMIARDIPKLESDKEVVTHIYPPESSTQSVAKLVN